MNDWPGTRFDLTMESGNERKRRAKEKGIERDDDDEEEEKCDCGHDRIKAEKSWLTVGENRSS